MAAPTDEQIKELAAQYVKQFDYIVGSIQVYWGLHKKFDQLLAQHKSAEATKLTNDLYNYAVNGILPAAMNWARFGDALNNAKINVPTLRVNRLFDATYLPDLLDFQKGLHNAKIVQNATSGQEQTGIIPLIIIAIVLIVAAFTAEEIVSQIDSSTAQQEKLVTATNKLCSDQGLSAADCKNMVALQEQTITTTEQNKPTSFLGGLENIALLGVAAWIGVSIIKSQSKHAA